MVSVVPERNLAVLPSLRVTPTADGCVVITRKFIEGVQAFQRTWRAPVVVYVEARNSPSNDLDNLTVSPSDLPFSLHIVDYAELAQSKFFRQSSIVLASADHRQNHLAVLCRRIGIPCVYVTEYSLQTRYQIIDCETSNPLMRLRRRMWAFFQELRQTAAITNASGVQCNGTPTFAMYQRLNRNHLLFFDTRITQSMLISLTELESRLASCLERKPLRLLYSGRLISMKGADHLVDVALSLRGMGVNFTLTICGDGNLLSAMKARVEENGLSALVKFRGVLDFRDELIPLVKKETDIFICCHRQGDPSCTYLETMSCGVPIIGYDNEAFAGLIEKANSGWVTPMNDPESIAAVLFRLDNDREAIASASYDALRFAECHTFDIEFDRRVEHLNMLVHSQGQSLTSKITNIG